MKFVTQPSTRPSHEPSSDRALLLQDADLSDLTAAVDDCTQDDGDDGNDGSDTDEEEEEETDDMAAGDKSFLCRKCQPRTRGGVSANCCRRARTPSPDVIEICVMEEEEGEEEEEKKGEGKNEKKKKPWKKRVRKRVWRVMRSSWKYLRRGMSGYSTGLASMFTWGVSFNQAVAVHTSKRDRRY